MSNSDIIKSIQQSLLAAVQGLEKLNTSPNLIEQERPIVATSGQLSIPPEVADGIESAKAGEFVEGPNLEEDEKLILDDYVPPSGDDDADEQLLPDEVEQEIAEDDEEADEDELSVDASDDELKPFEEEDNKQYRKKAKRGGLLLDETEEDGEDGVGEKHCSKVPFRIGPRKNRFKDTLVVHTDDIKTFDSKVRTQASIAAHEQITKRPAAAKVIVRCRVCNKKYKIDANLAPRRLTGNDKTTYKCDRCITKGRVRDE